MMLYNKVSATTNGDIEMPAGGKRPRAGRPSKIDVNAPPPSLVTSRAAYGSRLSSQQAILKQKEQELSLAVAQGNDCLIRTIILKQEKLLEGLIELAIGVHVEEIDKTTGMPIVYQRPPDRQAAQWLLEKVHGKPTVKTETKHDTHISIHHEVPRPDPDDVEKLERIALETKLGQTGSVYEVDLGGDDEDEGEELLEIR